MSNEQIKQLALQHGFKLKEQPDGTVDLNPYVYDFARALINDVKSQQFIEASNEDTEAMTNNQKGK